MFIGKHGELGALSVKVLQKFYRAGKEFNIIQHRGLPVRTINGQGFLDAVVAGEQADGALEAATDRRSDLLERRCGQAQSRQSVGVCAMNRGKMINERSVEIEEEGAEAMHEWRTLCGFRAVEAIRVSCR